MKKTVFLSLIAFGLILGLFWKDKREKLIFLFPSKLVRVKVIGEVSKPGIYELENGSTLRDALRLAGLDEPNSKMEHLLRQKLKDGQIIQIGKEYLK